MTTTAISLPARGFSPESPQPDPPQDAFRSLAPGEGRFSFVVDGAALCDRLRPALDELAASTGRAVVVLQNAFERVVGGATVLSKLLQDIQAELVNFAARRRFALAEVSRGAYLEAARVERSVPPRCPSWLLRTAPWAHGWGLTTRRGRRRTRAWA